MNYSLAIQRLTADKVERDPSLLRVALANVERWLSQGHTEPRRLEEWRQLILRAQEDPAAFRQLLRVLRSDEEKDLHFKGFHPFAGVLAREERRPAILECAYSH